jgi:general secretion pathway protein M
VTVSPPVSRLAALTLLVFVCWFAATLIAAPLLESIERDRESAARSRLLLARYNQLEADVPALQRQLASLRDSATAKAFLPDAASGLRVAEMQGALQKMASTAGATLRSSRTLPQTAEEGYYSVGVELELAATSPVLAGLLHSIETAEPIILVDRLAVQVPENGAGAKTADGQPQLNVSLRVVSYARSAAVRGGSQ